MPLAEKSVDRIVSNPPFGKQFGRPEDIGPLYQKAVTEYDRVLRAGGRAVLLVSDAGLLRDAARAVDWQAVQKIRVRVLGQPAAISVWRKS
jgi:23S rRNA G2445 N2-methylase RlmL